MTVTSMETELITTITQTTTFNHHCLQCGEHRLQRHKYMYN